jgi:hypothetical protein
VPGIKTDWSHENKNAVDSICMNREGDCGARWILL